MARKLWCVTEPKPTSELCDCLFETTAAGFLLQARGGLSEADQPELHPTKAEAMADLRERVARRAVKWARDFLRQIETPRCAETR